jgi:adenosylcobinamide-GDP ribazoletransferase
VPAEARDAGDGGEALAARLEHEPPEEGAAAAARGPGEMRSWPAAVRGARAAFVFFSRLPVGGFPYREGDWHWAPAHLPLVGAVVGAGSAAVFALASWLGLGPWLGACLALGASLWLTGALHEDGLADSADGLGGGSDRERVLAIMKDSRIGTYGAAALFVALLARTAALGELQASAWFAIVAVHVTGRVAPVWLLCALPYVNARADAKSHALVWSRPVHGAVALGWCALALTLGVGLAWLPWRAALAALLVPVVLTPPLAGYFRRRVGGVTGDLLGASEQIAEVGAWVAISAALAR